MNKSELKSRLRLTQDEYMTLSSATMSNVFSIPEFDIKNASKESQEVIRGLHCAIGIETELTELYEAVDAHLIDIPNIGEELGDCLWYIAEFERQFDIKLEWSSDLRNTYGFSGMNSALTYMKLNSGSLLDVYKKRIFYGRELSRSKIINHVKDLFLAIGQISESAGLEIEKIRCVNIQKLYERFGLYDGLSEFTEEKANNRNLTSEREILEKGI